MTEIRTLLKDIDKLAMEPHEPSKENLLEFGRECINAAQRFFANDTGNDKFYVRMSNIGKPLRQLWYDSRSDVKRAFTADDYRKFIFGDLIEALLILFCREAGHDVEETQMEVELNGVKGHKDLKLDGLNIDIKSASPYSFAKFAAGKLLEGGNNDPFGYLHQIAGYNEADEKGPTDEVGWLVFNKVSGEITLLLVDELRLPSASDRIDEVKAALAKDTPPERCFDDVEEGKSGNRKLDGTCTFCEHKRKCWPDVRAFKYSNQIRYLTKVEKEPNVEEIYDF